MRPELAAPDLGAAVICSGPEGPEFDAGARAGRPDDGKRTTATPLKVLYLGISGVLHPSATLYKLVHGRSPWDEGHHEYEGVPVLEQALEPWPEVRVVLTSTQPWSKGLEATLTHLGAIAPRVIGFTYEDLTSRAKLGPRRMPIGRNDYWRLTRSEVVRMHRGWLQPAAWVAVDDELALWTTDERRSHLVATDGCEGLLEPRKRDRLLTVLLGNFGVPSGG